MCNLYPPSWQYKQGQCIPFQEEAQPQLPIPAQVFLHQPTQARSSKAGVEPARLVDGSIGSPGRPPSRPSRRSRSEPNKEHGGAGPTAACGPLARGPRELEGEGDRGWPTGPAVRLALPPLFLTPPLLLLRAPSILFPLLPYKKNYILFAHHFISRLPIFHKYFHPSFFPSPLFSIQYICPTKPKKKCLLFLFVLLVNQKRNYLFIYFNFVLLVSQLIQIRIA